MRMRATDSSICFEPQHGYRNLVCARCGCANKGHAPRKTLHSYPCTSIFQRVTWDRVRVAGRVGVRVGLGLAHVPASCSIESPSLGHEVRAS